MNVRTIRSDLWSIRFHLIECAGTILFISTLAWTGSGADAMINEVFACHGSQNADCNFFTMTCAKGTGIRVLDTLYGFKDYPCRNSKARCFETGTNRQGCCVYNSSDCQEDYVPLHAYSVYSKCSTQQTCTSQAPNVILSDCKKASTYVYLTYECVPFTNEVSIDFCDNRTIYPAGQPTSLLFQESTNVYAGPTCSCRISTLLSNITATFVDIRMFRQKSGTGSECSSARLLSDPPTDISTQCSSSKNEEDNFVYDYPVSITGSQLKLTLEDLNKNNDLNDVPEVVWILVEGALRVDCSPSDLPDVTSQPITVTLPVTTHATSANPNITDTDKSSSDGKSEGNSAVIAGAVVGVLIVTVLVGIAVFIYFKKRTKAPKRTMARQNSYTAAGSVRSASNDIYDEINDSAPVRVYDPVYEPRKGEPVYDPVYEPSSTKGATAPPLHSISTTHTYQNVGNGDQPTNNENANSETKRKFVIPKRFKAPFSMVKRQTDKFVDFIKSRKDQEPRITKQRPREESGGSYDHLRIGGVTVQVSSPDDEPTHAYAHTAGIQRVNPALENANGINLQTTKDRMNSNQVDDEVKNTTSVADLHALHVGDEYIEFAFDVDKSNPNLVKMDKPDVSTNHLRPIPPARDPPSLNSSRAPSPLPKSSRSPSPLLFTQTNTPPISLDSSTHSGPCYDYADPDRVSPLLVRRSPQPPDSLLAGTQETEQMEDPPAYDYADVSEGEVEGGHEDQMESVYEDVERRLREASTKKHRSDPDVGHSLEGYEVPVTSQSRPVSSPTSGTTTRGVIETSNTNAELGASSDATTSTKQDSVKYMNLGTNKRTPLKPKTVTNSNTKVVPDLASELNLKMRKKKETHAKLSTAIDAKGITNATNANVVKSDNVSTKDYEKAPVKKSVLNMAKVFEKK